MTASTVLSPFIPQIIGILTKLISDVIDMKDDKMSDEQIKTYLNLVAGKEKAWKDL